MASKTLAANHKMGRAAISRGWPLRNCNWLQDMCSFSFAPFLMPCNGRPFQGGRWDTKTGQTADPYCAQCALSKRHAASAAIQSACIAHACFHQSNPPTLLLLDWTSPRIYTSYALEDSRRPYLGKTPGALSPPIGNTPATLFVFGCSFAAL